MLPGSIVAGMFDAHIIGHYRSQDATALRHSIAETVQPHVETPISLAGMGQLWLRRSPVTALSPLRPVFRQRQLGMLDTTDCANLKQVPGDCQFRGECLGRITWCLPMTTPAWLFRTTSSTRMTRGLFTSRGTIRFTC